MGSFGEFLQVLASFWQVIGEIFESFCVFLQVLAIFWQVLWVLASFLEVLANLGAFLSFGAPQLTPFWLLLLPWGPHSGEFYQVLACFW